MQLTRITQNNFNYFKDFFPDPEKYELGRAKELCLLGAVLDGCACGALALNISDSQTELAWIYVAPEYRNRGIAREMLDFLLREENDLGTIIAVYPDEGESGFFLDRLFFEHNFLIDTYKSFEFSFSVDDALKSPRLAFLKNFQNKDKHHRFFTLEEAPPRLLRSFDKTNLYDLKKYDRNLSIICSENEEFRGILLVRRVSEDEINLEYAYTYRARAWVLFAMFYELTRRVVMALRKGILHRNTILTFQLQGNKGSVLARKCMEQSECSQKWYHIARNWGWKMLGRRRIYT